MGRSFFSDKEALSEYRLVLCIFAVLVVLIQVLDRWADVDNYWGNINDVLIDGRMPYSDAPFEYPPLALLVFLVPRLVSWDIDSYHFAFAAMCIVFFLVAMHYGRRIADSLGIDRRLFFIVFVATAIGMYFFNLARYDIVPAALILMAISKYLDGRYHLAFAIIAVATMVKIYPIFVGLAFLLPFLARKEWRSAAVMMAIMASVMLIVELPFLIDDPSTAFSYMTYHSDRGIQVESVVANGVEIWNYIFPGSCHIEFTYGSHNLAGPLADSVSAVMNPVMAASVAAGAVFLLYAFLQASRSDPEGLERLALLSAVFLVLLFVVCSKVYSAQYGIWILTLAPLGFILVEGDGPRRRFLRGIILLAATSFVAAAVYACCGFDLQGINPILELLKNGMTIWLMSFLALGIYACAKGRERPDPSWPIGRFLGVSAEERGPSDDGERVVEGCQDLAPLLRYQDRVLDPDPADALDVDPRFGGHDVSRSQDVLRFLGNMDGLVHIHADPVAETVDERALEFRIVYDLPGSDIRSTGTCAVAVFRDTCELGFPDDLVSPFEDLRGIPEEDGARHVGAVAIVSGPEVEEGGVAPGKRIAAGRVVGFRRVCAESHDGVEGVARTAEGSHAVVDEGADLLLGDALMEHIGYLGGHFGRYGTCSSRGLDLLRILDGDGGVYGLGGIDDLYGSQRLLHVFDVRIRYGMDVESNPGATTQDAREGFVALIAVGVRVHDAPSLGSGLLLHLADDQMELPVRGHYGEGTLEDPVVPFGEIPERRVQERFPSVRDHDGIHAIGVRYQPLGPGSLHIAAHDSIAYNGLGSEHPPWRITEGIGCSSPDICARVRIAGMRGKCQHPFFMLGSHCSIRTAKGEDAHRPEGLRSGSG